MGWVVGWSIVYQLSFFSKVRDALGSLVSWSVID